MIYHVDDGHGRARCGEPCAGMFLVEREARATCDRCTDPLLVTIPNDIARRESFRKRLGAFKAFIDAARDCSLAMPDIEVVAVTGNARSYFNVGQLTRVSPAPRPAKAKRSKRNGSK